MICQKTFDIFLTLFLIGALAATVGCNASGSADGIEEDIRQLPQEVAFEQSGHADEEAEAFTHWDEDEPPAGEIFPVVPVTCAKCHNTAGFLDFLGITDPNERVVDNPVTIDPDADNALDCDICHNEKTFTWDTVIFPSGLAVNGTLGREALCMECHQGRTSTFTVREAVRAGEPDELPADMVNENLTFINIHYFAAAATRYGTEVKGGYEYIGKMYVGFFPHREAADICFECHLPHSLRIDVDLCAQCHSGVETEEDIRDIRRPSDSPDFDGDGNTAEGISFEIDGMRDILFEKIQNYANTTEGTKPIVYSGEAFPYFFIDTDGNGVLDEGEASFINQYDTWTPRLLKAAYNMQYTLKDPGCSAHNASYAMQLLYDSIVDLDPAAADLIHRPTDHQR